LPKMTATCYHGGPGNHKWPSAPFFCLNCALPSGKLA
jgi:hypothetical protein